MNSTFKLYAIPGLKLYHLLQLHLFYLCLYRGKVFSMIIERLSIGFELRIYPLNQKHAHLVQKLVQFVFSYNFQFVKYDLGV